MRAEKHRLQSAPSPPRTARTWLWAVPPTPSQTQFAFLFNLALCLKQVQTHFPCKV